METEHKFLAPLSIHLLLHSN